MSSKIRHKGVVESMANGVVRVKILQTAACAQCRAANHCSASESKEKLIDVYDSQASCRVGDEVVVSASTATGMRAVLLGFGIPFVLLVVVVWLLMSLTGNEPLSALCGLFSLVPYYALLYLLRHRLRRELSFSIE